MRHRHEVRLSGEDAERLVVIRWRRPAGDGGTESADAVGVIEAIDEDSFTIRQASGGVGGRPAPASSEADTGDLQPRPSRMEVIRSHPPAQSRQESRTGKGIGTRPARFIRLLPAKSVTVAREARSGDSSGVRRLQQARVRRPTALPA